MAGVPYGRRVDLTPSPAPFPLHRFMRGELDRHGEHTLTQCRRELGGMSATLIGSLGDPVATLRGSTMVATLLAEVQAEAAEKVLRSGGTWADVAVALGVTPDVARERFGG